MKRNIAEREKDYPQFDKEFGHIKGDTIVGVKHKSAIITLAKHLSKVVLTLKSYGRQASNIELAMNHWFQVIPRNLLRSISFDCGK